MTNTLSGKAFILEAFEEHVDEISSANSLINIDRFINLSQGRSSAMTIEFSGFVARIAMINNH